MNGAARETEQKRYKIQKGKLRRESHSACIIFKLASPFSFLFFPYFVTTEMYLEGIFRWILLKSSQ